MLQSCGDTVDWIIIVNFKISMSVTGLYRNDCMLRQIAKSVSQDNAPEKTLINTKEE